ncbi:MAG TPA: hypothetical protein ENI85_07800, partial [Deltaproteobacteria bacterium]|nr:hypothetical protein [Deltaproteobacteria bacterium]
MTARPLLLLGSLLIGIGWADRGGRIPQTLPLFCLVAGIATSAALLVRLMGGAGRRGAGRSEGGRPRHRASPTTGGGPGRLLALWLAMACLFVSGFDRFDRIRRGAEQDRRQAERALHQGLRIVEARIR